MTCSTAAAWSRIGAVLVDGSLTRRLERQDGLAADALDLAAGQSPVAATPAIAASSVSMSWNLSDDEPTFRTRMCTRSPQLW